MAIFYLELFWAIFVSNRVDSALFEFVLMPFSTEGCAELLGGCN